MEGPNMIIMSDTFRIDDLLDFSNEDIAGPIGESLLSSMDSTITELVDVDNVDSTGTGSLTGTKHLLDESNDHSADTNLCVPYDDIEGLEWLSKFVEDSFETPSRPMHSSDGLSVCMDFEPSYESGCKELFQRATSPVSVLDESCGSSAPERFNNKINNSNNLVYRDTSVPGRARSKRARTGGRVWCNSRILTTPHYSNAEAAAAGAATDTESLSSDSNVISGGDGHSSKLFDDRSSFQQSLKILMMTPPPKAVTTLKKPWKAGAGKKSGQVHQQDGSATQTWRCLHCATQRTPQWRAGPMGPKTLCNACGVRYKSGRLLPEYRPAGSPGYVGHKHSNSHKKILEMRRQREASQQHQSKLSMLSSSCHSSSPPLLLSAPPAILNDYDDDTGICTSQN